MKKRLLKDLVLLVEGVILLIMGILLSAMGVIVVSIPFIGAAIIDLIISLPHTPRPSSRKKITIT